MDKAGEFFEKYRNPLYIGVAVLVILIVIYFLFRQPQYMKLVPVVLAAPQREKFEGNSPQEGGEEDEVEYEQFQGTQEPVKIVVFYAPWCGFCKRFMEGNGSVWEILKRKNSHRKDLVFDQVNCDEKPDLATKFQIKEFPTILKFKNDKIEKFEGNREVDIIESFIDSE